MAWDAGIHVLRVCCGTLLHSSIFLSTYFEADMAADRVVHGVVNRHFCCFAHSSDSSPSTHTPRCCFLQFAAWLGTGIHLEAQRANAPVLCISCDRMPASCSRHAMLNVDRIVQSSCALCTIIPCVVFAVAVLLWHICSGALRWQNWSSDIARCQGQE